MPIIWYPGSEVSKYRARRVLIDGETFDSHAEAARWFELQILEKHGTVIELQRQVPFTLHAGVPSQSTVVGEYVADFCYYENRGTPDTPKWRRVVEDLKGFPTQLYKWKKRHVEIEYDVIVTETRARRRS